MLLDQVRAFARESDVLRPGDLLVVAVSGGPDSVVLLHALREMAPELGLALHVAHLDHGLRGEAGRGDARFVAELAREWGLPATIGAADVPRYRDETGLSVEAAARAVRYAFLAHLVARLGARGVAVGHTADDQVETLLLHFLRGAGLAGLRGMPPVQRLQVRGAARWRELWRAEAAEESQLTILRPLLAIWRAQVAQYATDHYLSYRHDASNEDVSYVRNRVRHQLLPALLTFNPNFKEAVLRTARLLTEDYAYLQGVADKAWSQVAREGPGAVTLDAPAFQSLAPSLRRLLIRKAVARLVGEPSDLGAEHVEAVLELAARGRTGAAVSLPRGLQALLSYDTIMLLHRMPAVPPLPTQGTAVRIPGVTEVGSGWRATAQVRDGPCPPGERDAWHADFDLDRVGEPVLVRRWLPGDRVRLGAGGRKKLQDVFVDNKVPRWQREAVPVVVGPGGVVWAVGEAVDQPARATSESHRVLCLRFQKGEAT